MRFNTLQRTVIGGSACPPAMLRTFEDDYGVEVIHAWGMTEMSPLGTLAKLNWEQRQRSPEEQRHLREKQGHVMFGVDMKVVGDDGNELPWDGKSFGDLYVRGPWVIDRYFRKDDSPLVDGWFPTGDVATIDTDGFMHITDRSKDVIKSGGEWISSIDLENIMMSHPQVAEAACIACSHPKWTERPLIVVVLRPEATVTREELLAFYDGKVAKWWRPGRRWFSPMNFPTRRPASCRSSGCAKYIGSMCCRRSVKASTSLPFTGLPPRSPFLVSCFPRSVSAIPQQQN